MTGTDPIGPFAGLHKATLIDYPGKVACVLFVTGCNLHCPYCHNPELARGRWPRRIPWPQVAAFLEQRKTFLDAVVISGGEPTLRPDLENVCRHVRSLGLAVKLDTNGTRPEVLARLLDQGLVDFVAMDIKTAPESYVPALSSTSVADALLSSIALIMEKAPDYAFRTTCIEPFASPGAMEPVVRRITGARRFILQAGRQERWLLPQAAAQGIRPMTAQQIKSLERMLAPHVQRLDVPQ